MSWSWSALIEVSRFEPLIVASPSRARRPGIAIPARSIATRPGSRSPSEPGLALAHEQERDLGHRRQVAARPDRAPLADDRRDATVQELDERQRDLGPAAGVAAGVDVDPARDRRPDRRDGGRIADAGRVVVDEVALELLDLLVGQGDLRELADAGVDAVHDLVGGDLLLEHRAAGGDPGECARRELDRCTGAGDTDEALEGQRRAIEDNWFRRGRRLGHRGGDEVDGGERGGRFVGDHEAHATGRERPMDVPGGPLSGTGRRIGCHAPGADNRDRPASDFSNPQNGGST